MKYEFKKISVWSAIKVSFLLNLIFGFMIGIFYAFLFMMLAALPSAMMNDNTRDAFSAVTGFAIFLIPFFMAFFFAIVNTIFVAIMSFAFNLIVKMVGGLELELNPIETAPAPPAPAVVPAHIPPPLPRYQPPQSGDIDYSI